MNAAGAAVDDRVDFSCNSSGAREFSDIEEGVRRDVRWLKDRVREGTLLEGTNVVGYIIENETGKVSSVAFWDIHGVKDALQLRVVD